MTGLVTVTSAPFAAPEMRARMEQSAGKSLDEIVRAAVPFMADADRAALRVTLVSGEQAAVIPARSWRRVYPHAGTHVVIRLVPEKDALKTILQILVTVAATALAAPWAGTLFGSLITAGVTALGGFLINLLIPQESGRNKEKPGFAISGWQNRANPDGPVPALLGAMRIAPQPVARYTEIVGDDQYVRACFLFSYGRCQISGLKIGDTPFDKFSDIEWEIREGTDADAPHTLITRQIYEEAMGRVLSRPLPRDAYGQIIDGAPSEEKPESVFTGSDGYRFGFVFSMPQGMSNIDDKGRVKSRSVRLAIRSRLNGAGAWTDHGEIKLTAAKTSSFFRQVFFDVAARGRYEFEFTRKTAESAKEQVRDQVVLAAVQTLRREYPLNFKHPLATLQVRVKATYQLNGTLDTVNGVAQRIVPDYDHATGTWIARPTSNPASLYRHALQAPERSKPLPDAMIDIAGLEHWHRFCAARGLTYNRLHDFESSDHEALRQIAGAGLASPHMDGAKWTVIIDEPQGHVTAHVNPRNSRAFRWELPYLELPDAVRVRFPDGENDFQSAEALIPWIGHQGDISLTEEWAFPGKTVFAEIWRLVMRRMLEVERRRETFTCIQDGDIRAAVRGDLVMAIAERLDDAQRAARVTAVRGNLVTLDDEIEFPAVPAALRFRVHDGEDDALGTSVLRPVAARAGRSSSVTLTGDGPLPEPGTIAHFGPLAADSLALRITRIERGEQGAAILTMTHAAPEIDAEVMAMTPPAWNPRVGADIGGSGAVPAAPLIVSLKSGVASGEDANSIVIILAPGPGSAALVTQYEIRARAAGAAEWRPSLAVTAASSGAVINDFAAGAAVEIAARAMSADGIPGVWSETRTVTIGASDSGAAGALVGAEAAGGLGALQVTFTTGANAQSVRIYLKHGIGGALDRTADFAREIAVEPFTTYTAVFGDATRVNLFPAASGASLDAGWSLSGSDLAKAAGTAGWAHAALGIAAGVKYRTRFTLISVTAGEVRVGLKGAADVTGAARTAAGTYYETLTAISGLTGAGASADAAFDGTVGGIIIYPETAACLPQGGKTIHIEPFNGDGAAGPLTAPIETTVT